MGVSLPQSPDSEFVVRAPVAWMKDIDEPVLVIEGSEGNADQLALLRENTPEDTNVSYVIVEGADHFDVLGPANAMLATQIAGSGALTLTGPAIAARRAEGR